MRCVWNLRAVFGLDSAVSIDLEVDALVCEAFNDLLHGIKLLDSAICHDTDALRSKVLEVHSNFLGDTGTKSN